jgi:1-acyl-sn-glycerol-3-phosphate acyltransferase
MRSLLAALVRLATGVRRLHELPHGGGPAIFFANHASHMDFVVVWAALPEETRELTHPAAAEDYWTANALRRWIACDIFRAILIPRRDVCRSNHPVDRLGVALEAGESVIIFPEGGRGETDEPGAFKSGLYHLARRYPGVPVVPVHLENLSRILPKGTKLPVPLIAQARFLAPIRIGPGEAKPAFLARARRALIDEPAA